MIHVNRLYHPLGYVPPREATPAERSRLAVWFHSLLSRVPVCPEREYRPHERMCWDCGEPRICCRCEIGGES